MNTRPISDCVCPDIGLPGHQEAECWGCRQLAEIARLEAALAEYQGVIDGRCEWDPIVMRDRALVAESDLAALQASLPGRIAEERAKVWESARKEVEGRFAEAYEVRNLFSQRAAAERTKVKGVAECKHERTTIGNDCAE